MLSSLRISNYALIRDIEISFDRGFTVITGETGAGKSILIGALGLVLGNRAESEALLEQDRKCVIEAEFIIGDYGLQDFFSRNELDFDDTCILRREISPAGKSRAFINDSPCSLELMRDLASNLIEIHSQHATLSLFKPTVQLGILDAWAGLQEEVAAYSKLYRAYLDKSKQLSDLLNRQESLRTSRDYLQFQYEELERAALRSGEKELLVQQLEVLEHSEEISRELAQIRAVFEDVGEGGIETMLHLIGSSLGKLTALSGRYSDMTAQFRELRDGLHEIQQAIERESAIIEADPGRLNELRERLDLIQRLEHKHGIEGDEALLALMHQFADDLAGIEQIDEQIDLCRTELEGLELSTHEKAAVISKVRQEAAGALSIEVESSLVHLNMKDACFRILANQEERPGPAGIDKVRFMFSANGPELMSEMSRIASGGELSRVMLALRANISERKLLPCIIFDEIDSGISGDTAGRVGRLMRSLGERMQVISITHQASIAGFGEQHLLVSKVDMSGQPSTTITKLAHNERIESIAKMLSGGRTSEAALLAARELLAD